MKKAFSLVELLVVIAIIGILFAVLLGTFGGATESARAAKCLSNMRVLVTAANSYAVGVEVNQDYPLAGNELVFTPGTDGQLHYWRAPGWIGGLAGDTSTVKTYSSYDLSAEDAHTVLTNGTLWSMTHGNRSVYTCPSHVKYRGDRKQTLPVWSYVMNCYFGYDYTGKGTEATTQWERVGKVKYGDLRIADKVIMFAELPITTTGGTSMETDDGENKNSTFSDCVLQYKAKINGRTYGNWAGEAESIGFVHKTGKTRYSAHVAFVDGHTETLDAPPANNGGITTEELTALLCEGVDYGHDAKGYHLVEDADQEHSDEDEFEE